MGRNKNSNQAIEKIVGAVVLAVAIGAIAAAGYFYLKGRSTLDWPWVEGIVTKSGTRSQHSPGDSGAPTTIADVRYRYTVDGVTYHNDTISLGQFGSSSASHAVKEARRYVAGSRVMVYHNPDNPRDAVLEHKTPWIFIGIFAGLGTILMFIGLGMLSGGFSASPSAAAWREMPISARERKAPRAAGKRMTAAVLFSSTLIAFLAFFFYTGEKNESIQGPGPVVDHPAQRHGPRPVSTYAKAETAPACEYRLKAQVAESQKIRLDDGIHSLYVTATLCIAEAEMKTASQSHLTWPTIARQLAAYDKAVFDPQTARSDNDNGARPEAFRLRLKRIEQDCLERLKDKGIFFVKAIRLESLRVFEAN